MFIAAHKLLRQRRKIVFAVLVLMLIPFVLMILKMRTSERLDAVLPKNNEIINDYTEILNHFKVMDLVVLDVGGSGDIGAAADDLYATLKASGKFLRIRYRISMEEQLEIFESFKRIRPLVVSESDIERIDRAFSDENLALAMRKLRRELIAPQGVFTKKMMLEDPVGINGIFLKKLLKLRSNTGGSEISDGRIWSKNQKHVLMLLEPIAPATDVRETEIIIELINNSIAALEVRHPAVKVRYTGAHRGTLDNRNLLREDISQISVVTIVAILILVFMVYRRKWLALLTFAPAMFGGIVALGAYVYLFETVSMIVVGFGIALIGVAVDYAIHLLYKYDSRTQGDAPGICEWLSPVSVPLSLSALTTVAALLSLLSSDFPLQRELGVFTGVGIFAAALFALFVLPLLLPDNFTSKRSLISLDKVFAAFFRAHKRHPIIVILFLVGVSVLCVYGASRVRFEGDITELNGLSKEMKLDDAEISKVWGREFSGAQVMVSGANLDEARRENDRVWDELKKLQLEGAIKGYASIAPVLPSLGRQELNRKRWDSYWKGAEKKYAATLERIAGEHKFKQGVFDAFWRDIKTVSSLDATPKGALGGLIGERIAKTDNRVYILSTFIPADIDRIDLATLRIKGVASSARVVMARTFMQELERLIKSSLVRASIIASIVVAIVFFLIGGGSMSFVLAVMIPLSLSLLWTVGLLGVFGVHINMVNSLFVVFVVGMSVDYSIFIASGYLKEYRTGHSFLANTSGAVTVSALTTVAALGSLIFAEHRALYTVGITASIGMLAGLLASLVATPLCMQLLLWKNGKYGLPKIRYLLAFIYGWGSLTIGATLFYIFLIVVSILFYPFRGRKLMAFKQNALSVMARLVVRGNPFGRWRYIDFDKLREQKKPVVLVLNHQVMYDSMVVFGLPIPKRIVMKPWGSKLPIYGGIVMITDQIIARPNEQEAWFKRAEESLREGVSVAIFPEGRRFLDGELKKFHVGAFKLAEQAGVDVMPVVTFGVQDFFNDHSFWSGDHNVWQKALSPISQGDDTPRQFMRRTRAIMAKELAEVRLLWAKGHTFRSKVAILYALRGFMFEYRVYFKLMTDPLYSNIHKLIAGKERVLNLGCGIGVLTNALLLMSAELQIDSVDASESKLQLAEKSCHFIERTTFKRSELEDVEDLTSYEMIFLIDALNGQSVEKQKSLLGRIAREISTGTKVVIRTQRDEIDMQNMLEELGLRNVEVDRDISRGSDILFVCEGA